MRRYTVVVNDCAAPPVPGTLWIRSRDTDLGPKNFTLGFDEMAAGLAAPLTERQLDWLEVLGHLFAIDIACERGAGDLDWSRSIQAWLPVRDATYWDARRPEIEGIWTDLTDDELRLHFEPVADARPAPRTTRAVYPDHDAVALISGGQDSFVGALDLIHSGARLLLLSHSAGGATNTAQTRVEHHLRRVAPDLVRVKLSARRAQNMTLPGNESSQRSRTFLYVGAAAVLAAAGGSNQVWVNENGIMAIHVPLTAARLGSLSTHTASPRILERMSRLASDVLGVDVAIHNRLISLTKPEVVERAVALGFGDQLADTVSCWQISRHPDHCGVCVPCVIRRIACMTHGVADVHYRVDLLNDASTLDDDRTRDNLVHFVSFINDLQTLPDLELEYTYPELMNGTPVLTLSESVELHRRWADQAASILFNHPVPASLR